MKTIGILGGMSPESTVTYYTTLNRLTKARLGGYASAKILLHSVNFAETHAAQTAGNWDGIGQTLASAARGLQATGADMILLATNTMHKCAPQIQSAINIPFLHIGDTCAEALKNENMRHPILLGTRYTMSETFYTDALESSGIQAVIPDPASQDIIHQVIFDELVNGVATNESRQRYLNIINNLKENGADSIILGCTEIGMLLNAQNCPLPVFDTLDLHCRAAIKIALD